MTVDVQSETACAEDDTSHRERSVGRAIHFSLFQQITVILVAMFIKDGGAALHLAIYAAIASWAPIAAIVCHQATQRSYVPSNVHMAIVRHSFWIVFVVLVVVSGVTR
jgi:hypothetical protein